ncbi:MAG TPA: hypothetical protein VL175_14820 [Pirellulales bacterium]|nr:hypothetical protein [Pirellulales bacterium]
MEFNRNQYFMLGLVILLLGIQVRAVETFVLNEKASRFVAERLSPVMDGEGGSSTLVPSLAPNARRTLRPPVWLGYALISIGAVLILHSLAMKRPGG